MKFSVVCFCEIKVFKVNTEVYCHFTATVLCCFNTILLSDRWFIYFWFSNTFFLCCWSLAMLSLCSYNQLLKRQTIWTVKVTVAPAKQACMSLFIFYLFIIIILHLTSHIFKPWLVLNIAYTTLIVVVITNLGLVAILHIYISYISARLLVKNTLKPPIYIWCIGYLMYRATQTYFKKIPRCC